MEHFSPMVKAAFEYGWNKTDVKPDMVFHVNPFYKNPHSGKMTLGEESKATNDVASIMNDIGKHLETEELLIYFKAETHLELTGYSKEEIADAIKEIDGRRKNGTWNSDKAKYYKKKYEYFKDDLEDDDDDDDSDDRFHYRK